MTRPSTRRPAAHLLLSMMSSVRSAEPRICHSSKTRARLPLLLRDDKSRNPYCCALSGRCVFGASPCFRIIVLCAT
ncbi:hypothetical protein F4677DRAFT_431890 [Hypoxylon crocopeplum]|nr:hypothetical protein F4677DRAFT_431890 [Hypoxylon crocopeplum]